MGNLDNIKLTNITLNNSSSSYCSIESPNASIEWNDLSCELKKLKVDVFIEKFVYRKQNITKTVNVFNNLCGQFKFGELSAVMGPSGAGKSKLLECIICRRGTGVNGFVGLNGLKKVKVSFIPQNDHFFSVLTVREALMFAYKLHKTKKTKDDNENTANLVMKQLSLENCADTRICNLSGGQTKRLSVAQELLSKPDILILDEPTSGLDSSSCIQTIELLRSLTQQNQAMAIIASIHQPSASVFNLFNRVYILSSVGNCIYDGPPNDVIQWIREFNLNIPEYYNPADFMIEVSNGVYGHDCIQEMSTTVTQHFKEMLNNKQSKAIKMSESFKRQNRSFCKHVKVLSGRSLSILLRDPFAFIFQITMQILLAANIGLIFYGVGRSSGCPRPLPSSVEVNEVEAWKNGNKEENENVYKNIGNMMFIVVVCIFQGCALNVVTFPLTIQVIKKEISNGWYTTMAYYAGFIIADTPLQLLNSVLFSTLVYLFTSQPLEFERYAFFATFVTLAACIAQIHGIIFGLLFNKNLTTAILVSIATILPFVLFGGFVMKPHKLPYNLEIVSRLSFFRYAFEAMSVAVYGNRCGDEFQQSLQNRIETAKSMFTVTCPNSHQLILSEMNENNVTTSDTLFGAMFPVYFDAAYDSNGNAISNVIPAFKLTISALDYLVILACFVAVYRIVSLLVFRIIVNKTE